MQVLVVTNPSRRLKGILRQHGLEVEPNVFALDLNTRDVERLWQQVLDVGSHSQNFRASLISPATGKPGFSHKGFGHSEPRTTVVDGITLQSLRR